MQHGVTSRGILTLQYRCENDLSAKMILSKEEICRWANTSDSKRNFKEGERIINAGHIIYCGKNIDFNGSVRCEVKCEVLVYKQFKKRTSCSASIQLLVSSSKKIRNQVWRRLWKFNEPTNRRTVQELRTNRPKPGGRILPSDRLFIFSITGKKPAGKWLC